MARTFLVGVRGESHSNEDGSSRQQLIRKLRTNDALILEADPNNAHDRWAVKVLTQFGEQVGWLPSDARDSDALLKGEPLRASVHAVTGGTSWVKRFLGKKSVGLVLRITKEEPDWKRRARLEELARPYDEQVGMALKLEKDGEIDAAIAAMKEAIGAIRQMTADNRLVSAHRSAPAPVDRLSMLLERKKLYGDSLAVIEEWQQHFDPVQPTRSTAETIRKRAERLKLKAEK